MSVLLPSAVCLICPLHCLNKEIRGKCARSQPKEEWEGGKRETVWKKRMNTEMHYAVGACHSHSVILFHPFFKKFVPLQKRCIFAENIDLVFRHYKMIYEYISMARANTIAHYSNQRPEKPLLCLMGLVGFLWFRLKCHYGFYSTKAA